LNFALYEHRHGVETTPGNRVVYDLAGDLAFFGSAHVDGRALVWEVGAAIEDGEALIQREVELDSAGRWLARCDRIDFPPGGVAYLHTHPGPGIRYLLRGELTVETEGAVATFGPGGAWFEPGPEPVLAKASTAEETSFVRVLLLPAEWEGRRTIRYVDPADEDKPKLQRPTVYFDRPLEL
jgi:quercetin dioxygenase-like cupin family protein